jgi:hypothetical protein
VDQSQNSANRPEAVYVNLLIVPAGSTLDLNGLKVYARSVLAQGSLVGGTVSRVANRSVIALKTPTQGSISVAGELDEWTFSGHSGRSVTVVLNPGSGNPPAAPSPYLGYAEVSLLDPAGVILATATDSTLGSVVSFNDIPLTFDGTYRVQVRASSSHASNTGNYMITVSEAFFPRITSSAPSGETQPGVDSITFAYNHAMDQTSFSLAEDVISFTGPGGAIAPTGFTWTDARHLQVQFGVQSSLGQYQMVLGPSILDLDGNPLDQDQDSIGGDPIKDRYVATFTIEGPRVLNYRPIDRIPGAFHAIDLAFNEPMDQSSFSPGDDIVSFTGPMGSIVVSGSQWMDDHTLEIQFSVQTDIGQYELVIGPNIVDRSAHPMDQNQNYVAGEPTNDTLAATVFVTASGMIESDTVFASPAPIFISSNLSVASGATLTIEPGTILKFAAGAGLKVYGRLVALGTAANPVIFTSVKDDSAGGDTNGDGAASSPAAGDWAGISFFNPTTASTLNGVSVRYTTTGLSVGTYNGPTSGYAKLNGAVLEHDKLAIEAGSAYSQIEAHNALIVGNEQGILAVGTAGVTLRNCTIAGNSSAGTIGHPVLTMANTIVAFNARGFSGWSNAQDLEVRNSDIADADSAQFIRNVIGAQTFQQNGNIVADPLFIDRTTGNYELGSGSPAIDAAYGSFAPSADILGRARYDDSGMPNSGTSCPAYADMGAFERQEPTTAPDLAVTFASRPTPEFVHAGDPLTLQWTVTNVGQRNAVGPWQDIVYLSSAPVPSPDDKILVQQTHYGTLAPGSSYSSTFFGECSEHAWHALPSGPNQRRRHPH